jgi:late competence protein required for DNA uptake (superfamily II DNA/RNA helicase)
MNNEDWCAPARKTDHKSKSGIKYRDIKDRKFENTFDERQVTRLVPKKEKGRRKKKKDDYERVSVPRPPAEKVEYLCNSCNNYEERYQSWVFDSASANEAYFCRDCMKGGSGKARKRPVKRD